jgi:hypothetical protein
MMQSTGRLTVELKRLMRESYDRCRKCGRALDKGVPAYAGYAEDGAPLYVGRCCEGSIVELGTHVYWWWRTYKRPEPSAPLWRFMDFAKFVALLKDRALYFSRADHLGDRFEGARGIAAKKSQWDEHCLQYFREAITNPPTGTCNLSKDEVEREANRLLKQIEEIGQQDLRRTYVSCWHENEGESEALWRLYCPPPTAGIAIRAEYSSLNLSVGDNPEIEIGRVQYIDFQKQFSGTYDRIFWKRKSLSHESEVRAVIQRSQLGDKVGILVPVDISKLIKAIVISPFAPKWFKSVLADTLEKFEVQAPIDSDLIAEPFF